MRNKLKYYSYYYQYLGHKIHISLALALLIGVLDAFGLTLFLPLLQMISETAVDAEKMGNLSFLVDLMNGLGLSLSLQTALLFMFIFFTLKGIAKYFSEMYNVSLNQYFVKHIRLTILGGLNAMSYNYFVTADVGRIQNTMTGEVDRVAASYHAYFKTLQHGVLVLVYMAFAFFVNWQFAILVALGGWLTHFLYKMVYKRTMRFSKDLTSHYHNYEGEVIQHVANYKYLKATGLIHAFGERLQSTIVRIEDSIKKMSAMTAVLNSAREPLLIAVVATVIIIQTQFFQGDLSHLLISLLFFYRALSALASIQSSWNNFLAVSGSLNNMKAFQKELESNAQHNTGDKSARFQKKITLKNLSFSYGTMTILEDINLEVHKNKTLAFVGESGSGKTTLVNIICGLLVPEKGDIKMDTNHYQDLDMTAFQKRIGYITQDPVIFNDSIFNNVTFWAPKTPENIARFQKVIKQASIADFIDTLTEKENTRLGNNGINLSGGQKQRVSIARELYKDIDILIMDEATSALDSETEQYIQQQIEQLKAEYTILIIAHRLSTIKNVDKVVLVDKGKIKDSGTYQQLALYNPQFQQMLSIQEVNVMGVGS